MGAAVAPCFLDSPNTLCRIGDNVRNLTVVVLGIITLALILCVENIARTEETAQPAAAPAVTGQPVAGPEVPPQPAKPTLVTEQARLSYAIGNSIGRDFKRAGIQVTLDIFMQGMKDAIEGSETLMTQQEMEETIGAFQRSQQAKAEAAVKQFSEKNLKEGEEFLAKNATAQGVKVLPSGLQYKIIKEGDGAKPTLNDTVHVNYRGRLLDGTEFESSYKLGKPAEFMLPRLIPGMREALLLMPAGSKWELYIPPSLAYGKEGAYGAIPPNAVLVFEVEVVSMEKAPAAGAN